MSKTTKLVLSGYYGFDNAGDEAVLLSILQQLKKQNITPVVLSNNPEKTTSLYNVESYHRMKLSEIKKAIRTSDGLISGGGSLLQDVTSLKSSFYYLAIMKIAHFYKKPVFFYSQGVGPLNRKWTYPFLKSVISKCTYISVRDTSSKELLRTIGIKNDIAVSIDPVLGIEHDSTHIDLSSELKKMLSHKPVVISVRQWNNDEKIVAEMKSITADLVKQNIPVLFLPFHIPHDVDISNDIASSFSESELVTVIDKELSVPAMLELISNSRFLIGMRLHSLIFAASQSVPFIGISYDPKIDAFMELYNKKASTNTETFNGQAVIRDYNAIIQQPNEEIKNIHVAFESIQKRLLLPIETIRNYFNN